MSTLAGLVIRSWPHRPGALCGSSLRELSRTESTRHGKIKGGRPVNAPVCRPRCQQGAVQQGWAPQSLEHPRRPAGEEGGQAFPPPRAALQLGRDWPGQSANGCVAWCGPPRKGSTGRGRQTCPPRRHKGGKAHRRRSRQGPAMKPWPTHPLLLIYMSSRTAQRALLGCSVQLVSGSLGLSNHQAPRRFPK